MRRRRERSDRRIAHWNRLPPRGSTRKTKPKPSARLPNEPLRKPQLMPNVRRNALAAEKNNRAATETHLAPVVGVAVMADTRGVVPTPLVERLGSPFPV